jgi:hypothetical protein
VKLALPADASTSSSADFSQLTNVSCTAAQRCIAVGSYIDKAGKTKGMVVAEQDGRWGMVSEPVLPANAARGQQWALTTVACGSITSCVAVGQYLDHAGSSQALAVTGTP